MNSLALFLSVKHRKCRYTHSLVVSCSYWEFQLGIGSIPIKLLACTIKMYVHGMGTVLSTVMRIKLST